MAYLTVTEAADLASVSRGTIYNKIESGELSRTSDGIDTAELRRVFGELSLQSPTRQKRQLSTPNADTTDVVTPTADIAHALLARLDAADAEKLWYKEMLESKDKQLAERDAKLQALLPAPGEATPLEQANREIGRYQAQLEQFQEKVEELQRQIKIPRKKILGIF